MKGEVGVGGKRRKRKRVGGRKVGQKEEGRRVRRGEGKSGEEQVEKNGKRGRKRPGEGRKGKREVEKNKEGNLQYELIIMPSP